MFSKLEISHWEEIENPTYEEININFSNLEINELEKFLNRKLINLSEKVDEYGDYEYYISTQLAKDYDVNLHIFCDDLVNILTIYYAFNKKISIIKRYDEWYYVFINSLSIMPLSSISSDSDVYKCDQFDGLINCFKEEIDLKH